MAHCAIVEQILVRTLPTMSVRARQIASSGLLVYHVAIKLCLAAFLVRLQLSQATGCNCVIVGVAHILFNQLLLCHRIRFYFRTDNQLQNAIVWLFEILDKLLMSVR